MTHLTKPVTRSTMIHHDGNLVGVTIHPGVENTLLIFHQVKGHKWSVSMPLVDAFDIAMRSAVVMSSDEVEVLRNTREKINLNPKYKPEEAKAICAAIDAQIAAWEIDDTLGYNDQDKLDDD